MHWPKIEAPDMLRAENPLYLLSMYEVLMLVRYMPYRQTNVALENACMYAPSPV